MINFYFNLISLLINLMN